LIWNEEGKAVNQERTGREKEEAQREAGSKESLARMRLSRGAVKKKIVSWPFCNSLFLSSQDRL